jgi:hypothetical protein
MHVGEATRKLPPKPPDLVRGQRLTFPLALGEEVPQIAPAQELEDEVLGTVCLPAVVQGDDVVVVSDLGKDRCLPHPALGI